VGEGAEVGGRRYVFLDLKEVGGWPQVIVPFRTGVIYRHQYGGTACLHAELEGYLVPVHSAATLEIFDELFVKRWRGSGMRTSLMTAEELDLLRRAVGYIRFAGDLDEEEVRLEVDDARLAALDEAWVPVLTPHGPSFLAWSNSD
jgi:hypothetical protein